MTKRSYIAAAAIALAFSGTSFANAAGENPASGKTGSSATPGAPASSATAQCDSLSGTRKEQCMRQAQQGRDNIDSATGATSGGGRGTAGSPAKQPNEAAPTGGAATGKARPY